MVDVWVTVTLDQFISSAGSAQGGVRQCALCGDRPPRGDEQAVVAQLRTHLERHHGAVIEDTDARTSARVRKALVKQGWTPPKDLPAQAAAGSTEGLGGGASTRQPSP